MLRVLKLLKEVPPVLEQRVRGESVYCEKYRHFINQHDSLVKFHSQTE